MRTINQSRPFIILSNWGAGLNPDQLEPVTDLRLSSALSFGRCQIDDELRFLFSQAFLFLGDSNTCFVRLLTVTTSVE